MLGDPTLYTRTDEVQSAWRFVSAILDAWKRARCPSSRFLRRRKLGPGSRRCLDRRRRGPLALALNAGQGFQTALLRKTRVHCSTEAWRFPDADHHHSLIDGQGISGRACATSRPSWPGSGGRPLESSAAPNPKAPMSHASSWPTSCSNASTRDVESLAPVLETVMERFPCRAIVLCGSDRPARKSPPRSRHSVICHLRASRKCAPSGSSCAPDRTPSTFFPAQCGRCSRPTCRTCSGGPATPENTNPSFATWPAFARGWSSTCPIPARSRRPSAGPRPGNRHLRPRQRLVRPGPLARAGRAVLRCPRSSSKSWNGSTRWSWRPSHPNPAQPTRLAIWLVAWLAGQLGWKPPKPPGVPAGRRFVVHPDRQLPGRARRDIGAHRDACRTWRAAPPAPQLAAVTIKTRPRTGESSSAEIDRLVRPWPGSPAVLVETETPASCRLPRAIDAPELDAAHRIAAALESSRIDIPFQNALPIALWLLEP